VMAHKPGNVGVILYHEDARFHAPIVTVTSRVT